MFNSLLNLHNTLFYIFYIFYSFLFLLLCLKVFLVDRTDHEMQCGGHGNQAGHCIHGVVVEEWTGNNIYEPLDIGKVKTI